MTTRTILAFAALAALAGCQIPNSAPPPPPGMEAYGDAQAPGASSQNAVPRPPPMVPR